MSSQREAYQIPTGQQSPAAGMAMRSVVNTSSAANDEGLPMRYICGDCGTTFPLKRADTIRCVECGCRVLYKERTKRYCARSPHGIHCTCPPLRKKGELPSTKKGRAEFDGKGAFDI